MKKLYVGNLPFQCDEHQLTDWFSQAGITVDTVTLIRDRLSGQLRGFGFVEVTSDDDAQRACETLNGKDFLGRRLVVNVARPPREGGGGGRGRGGGGRGRGGPGGERGRDRDW